MADTKTAKLYWGPGPLPKGAKIMGVHSDKKGTGALIKMPNGVKVCGNAGVIRRVK